MAKYQDFYLKIANKIINGELLPGDRLPSSAELARQNNISYMTAYKVYEQLCRNQLVEARPRQGFFVRSVEPENFSVATKLQVGRVGLLLSMASSLYSDFYNQLTLRLFNTGHAPVALGYSWMMKDLSHDKARELLLSYAGSGIETLIIRGDAYFPYNALWEVRNAFRKIIFVMFYSGEMPFDGAAKVLFDMRAAGRLAAAYLLKNHFDKMVFLTQEPAGEGVRRKHGVSGKLFDLEMLDGVEDACRENHIDFYASGKIIARNMPYGEQDAEVKKSLADALRSGCDSVICMNDIRALGVYQLAGELGLKIGRDLGVVGNFNTEFGASLTPPLSSVDLNVPMLVEGVISALTGNIGSLPLHIPPQLIERK